MKKNNRVLQIMREEYRSHLLGVLKEVNVFDSRGELVISQDLKVIHEPSGYEYTVDSVKGKDGSAEITLRMPEVPRPSAKSPDSIESPEEPAQPAASLEDEEFPQIDLGEDDDDDEDDDEDSKVDVGKKAYPKEIEAPEEDEESEGDTFIVDQKEFEKHYKEA
jgi:hypothetical protein